MEVQVGESALLQVVAEPKEMLSVVTDSNGRVTKVRINFSSLSVMQECWRKVEYSLLRGLRQRLESPATLFGSAIHKALEVYYLAPRTERNLPPKYRETMEMIGTGFWQNEWEEITVFRAARAFVEKAEPLNALPAENKRSVVGGVWILRHYFERYYGDPFVVMTDEHGPIVERKFTLDLGDVRWISAAGLTQTTRLELFGTIDVVLRNEQTEQILVTDHKTTSQLYGFYDRVKPNHQYTAYMLGAQRCLGLKTEDFLVNALEVKLIPKTARGSGPQFARQITNRTQGDFNEFLVALTDSVRHFLQLRETASYPLSAPGPCSSYGGCSYLDICSSPEELRESVIRAKYSDTGSQAERAEKESAS